MDPLEARIAHKMFIGGSWRDAASGELIQSVDPSTGEPWRQFPAGGNEDAEAAVAAAVQGQQNWAAQSASSRASILRRMGSVIDENRDYLAALQSRETGRTVTEHVSEMARVPEWFEFYAGAAVRGLGDVIHDDGGLFAYTLRRPSGVVAAIVPWNSPVNLATWKIAPALASGNAVVVKPSEIASVGVIEFVRLLTEADLPPGVLNVLTGFGSDVGRPLIQDPRVRVVSFTGSVDTARQIMRDSSNHLARLILECGGKSPNIVFRDANLDAAAPVIARSAFKSTGQSCSLGSRLVIEDAVADEVIDRIVKYAKSLHIGPAWLHDSQFGPQATREQLDKTLSYVDIGNQDAELVYGGGRPADVPAGGHYVQPTVFDQVPETSRIVTDEIFGPVLAVQRFHSEEEAWRLANQTRFGLVSAVWTEDIARAFRFTQKVTAGLLTVNTYRPVLWNLPYGGFKDSGIGRENGDEAIREYTELTSVVWGTGVQTS